MPKHNNASDYDEAVVVSNGSTECQDSDIEYEPPEFSEENETVTKASSSTDGLEEQLQYNLAAFFLKLQTILHVSQRATQEIIEHIDQLFTLTQPLVREAVVKILIEHDCTFTDTLVNEIVEAVSESNVWHKCVTSEGPLSTAKRRKTYYEEKFHLLSL